MMHDLACLPFKAIDHVFFRKFNYIKIVKNLLRLRQLKFRSQNVFKTYFPHSHFPLNLEAEIDDQYEHFY